MTAEKLESSTSEPSPLEGLVRNPNVQVVSFEGLSVGETFPTSDARIVDLKTDPGSRIAFCIGVRQMFGFEEGDSRASDWREWQRTLIKPANLMTAYNFGLGEGSTVIPSAAEFAEAYRSGLRAVDNISRRFRQYSFLTSTEPDAETIVTFRTNGHGFRVLRKDQLHHRVFILPSFRLPART